MRLNSERVWGRRVQRWARKHAYQMRVPPNGLKEDTAVSWQYVMISCLVEHLAPREGLLRGISGQLGRFPDLHQDSHSVS